MSSEQHVKNGWNIADARMRSVAEASPDFVLVVDFDGRIEYLNRTNGRVAVSRFVGTNVFELLREPHASELRKCTNRVRESGKVDQCEVEYQNWDDEVRYMEVRVGPVLRGGQVVAFSFNARDITSGKLADSQPQSGRRPDAALRPVTGSPGDEGTGRPIQVKLERRLDFETLLSDLSGEFACVPTRENVDRLIDRILMKTARFLDAQRALMLQWLPDRGLPQCTHEWHAEQISPVMHLLTDQGFRHYPWLLHKLHTGSPFVIQSVNQLPDEAGREREMMTAQGARSVAGLPLSVDGRLLGAVCFSSVGVERHWSEETICRLKIIGGLVANALIRRQTDSALRRAHDGLQHLTASVSAGLWSVRVESDGQWQDHYSSPVMEKITGRPAEFFGNSLEKWLTVVCDEDRQQVRTATERLVRCAPTHDETEYRIILADGSARWVRNSINARCLPDSSVRLDGIVIDITDRRLAEEQLRHHQEELAHAGRLSTMGELVASIAHEINQPLYAIANYAGACQNSLTTTNESSLGRISDWAREIQVQAKRAGAIIARLGDFVRKAPPHRSTLNMNELIIDSIDLMRFEARSHQARVGIDLAPPTPLVLADRVQIQQVVVNLLRNAFDALEFVPPPARRVAITVARTDDHVSVHVTDCGQGLADDTQSRLFDPFFTTKEDGMGMGLAISKSIIEAHGGRLWATPNQETGATFHFLLPALGGP